MEQLEKKLVTLKHENGDRQFEVLALGELGILPWSSLVHGSEHKTTFMIVHIPSGAPLGFQYYHDLDKAGDALAELAKLRNTWDFMIDLTDEERLKVVHQLVKIGRRFDACDECATMAIKKSGEIRQKRGVDNDLLGGYNGYSVPEKA